MKHLIFLALAALVVAGCQSDPTPVGPQDGAVWVDVDVSVPQPNCPDASCEPMPDLPEAPCPTPTSPCPDPSISSTALLGDPLPPLQYAGMPPNFAAPAEPDSRPDAPWSAVLFGAGLSALLVGAFMSRRVRVLAPAVLLCFMLTGCAVAPVLRSDLDDAIEAERHVDEVKAETFGRAIADGKDLQVATGEAFGAYVGARPERPSSGGIDVLGILGMVLGGGVTGTGLVRLLRGTPLKSGSGNGKTA